MHLSMQRTLEQLAVVLSDRRGIAQFLEDLQDGLVCLLLLPLLVCLYYG
jgi:hypothetical protein